MKGFCIFALYIIIYTHSVCNALIAPQTASALLRQHQNIRTRSTTACYVSFDPDSTISDDQSSILRSTIQRDGLISRLLSSDIVSTSLALLASLVVAAVVISWEDYTSLRTLPSRSWRSSAISTRIINEQSSNHHYWGQATTLGLAFNENDRIEQQSNMKFDSVIMTTGNLDSSLPRIRSYNEVLQQHRDERVPIWRYFLHDTSSTVGATEGQNAVHTVCACLKSLSDVNNLFDNYQWDSVRSALQSSPWSDLNQAAVVLRSIERQSNNNNNHISTVGFDWGSCAWRRQCGAWADTIEALDEIDSLLGVLEPYEVRYCMDIVERSLRDLLTVVKDHTRYISTADYAYIHNELAPYKAHREFQAFDPKVDTEDDEEWRIDDSYMQALRDLRIDED